MGPRGGIVTRHPSKMARTVSVRLSLATELFAERKAKKSGRPLTPKRPAFAFLVTPKLPLGGRSVKLDEETDTALSALVNSKFSKSLTYFLNNFILVT
jgi:hypothetical protein